MAGLNVFFYFFVCFLLLFIAATLKAFALNKENHLLADQLTETTISLEKARQHLAKILAQHEQTSDFHNSLGRAKLSANLQQPQLASILSQERPRNSPERYNYVHSLTEKGMSVEEIATILAISTHEAGQLVTLTKIAQGN